jgi:hypothetical protein
MNSKTHWEYFMRITAGDFVTPWQAPLAKVLLVAVVLSLVVVWLKNKAKLPKGYVLLWVWWLVPLAIPTLISFYKPVFFYRYLVFTSVPILLIIFWGLSVIKKELAYILGVVLMIFYLRTDYLIFAKFPRSFREEVQSVFNTQTPPGEQAPIYTYLPSFAEVEFYVNFSDGQKGDRAPVKVVPEGLVQFSGRSLLDKYEALGLVEIKEPTEDTYWELNQGPTSKLH